MSGWSLPQNRSLRWVAERKPKRRSRWRDFSLVSTHSRPSVSRKSDSAPPAQITKSPGTPAQIPSRAESAAIMEASPLSRSKRMPASAAAIFSMASTWNLVPRSASATAAMANKGSRMSRRRSCRERGTRLRVRTRLQPAESAPQGKIDRMSLRHIYLRCVRRCARGLPES